MANIPGNDRIKIGEGGRFVIPAAFRKALGIEVGDELILRLQDGELHLFQQKQALKKIQEAFKKIDNGKNTVDDFLAFRKKEWGEE
jgi:AbrB family looped-hinge helix DNA binding protein